MASLNPEISAQRSSRRPMTLHNSGYWAALFLAITLLAFWPSYFAKLPARMDLYTHVHAVLMTVWFALLIVQPFLIRREGRVWHRRLGRLSYLLVPLIAVSWFLLIHVRARNMTDATFAKDGYFFYLPFVSSVLFLAAWGMAIVRRSTPPLHARYMVCTALAAIDAVAARLMFASLPPFENPQFYALIGFGLTDGILLMLFLLDRGPHRRAFAHMLLLFVVLHAFWFTGAQTDSWLAVVRWFRALPLT
jgi:hypothetical protein